ncbi:MAG: UTP--glucose-phosphate uridylyltransferase [Gemmatimonadaceae bacterium]|jgi:UTP-glucose-1-phosphate uridylyltransferase|nr:UTP--glucose-phosphate uridylyltransferase [Gemmatimonadaceae bacterium]
MSSLTKGAAKELLPIAGVPLVLRVMEECAASGVRDVLIVSAPGKDDLNEIVRVAAGRPRMPERVEVVTQENPRGLADAIRLGREFVGSDKFGVALPDNLFLGDEPALAQLFKVHERTGKNVVAIVQLSAADRDRYGPTAIYPGRLEGDEYIIESIPNKGPRHTTFDLEGAPSAFTGVGRYVFLPEVFSAIDEVESELPRGKELDDVPVLQLLLIRRRLTGCRIRGDFLDVGLPTGYREADERLVHERP